MSAHPLKYAAPLFIFVATLFSSGAGAADNAKTTRATTLSSQDKQFVEKAARAGHAEIATGKLAGSKGSRDDIKKFGEQMVQDHAKTGDELRQIAEGKGMTLPAEADANHQKLLKRLEGLAGAQFDKVYVQEAGVKDHKEAVALFTKQAKDGKDPDLKAFAAKTLPTIKHHFQMAQDLARTAGKK